MTDNKLQEDIIEINSEKNSDYLESVSPKRKINEEELKRIIK